MENRNSFFDRIEKKTNVKKEDILSLARSIQGKDLKDEETLRNLIHDVSKLAGKEVSIEKENKIIEAVKKDKTETITVPLRAKLMLQPRSPAA